MNFLTLCLERVITVWHGTSQSQKFNACCRKKTVWSWNSLLRIPLSTAMLLPMHVVTEYVHKKHGENNWFREASACRSPNCTLQLCWACKWKRKIHRFGRTVRLEKGEARDYLKRLETAHVCNPTFIASLCLCVSYLWFLNSHLQISQIYFALSLSLSKPLILAVSLQWLQNVPLHWTFLYHSSFCI